MTEDLERLSVQRLRLPHLLHTPGTNSVAELDWLHRVSARTPVRVNETAWRTNLPYRYGWFLFLHQYYWETHEVWEVVWKRASINSRERFLLQGLIQLANAGLKGKQQKLRAKARLLNNAGDLFNEVFANTDYQHPGDSVMGVTNALTEKLLLKMH